MRAANVSFCSALGPPHWVGVPDVVNLLIDGICYGFDHTASCSKMVTSPFPGKKKFGWSLQNIDSLCEK